MVKPLLLYACKRCGECCRYLNAPLENMPPAVREWLIITRGAKVAGKTLLIEHPCRFLKYNAQGLAGCEIWGTPEYPEVCRRFDGSLSDAYYIPPGCAMRH